MGAATPGARQPVHTAAPEADGRVSMPIDGPEQWV
jgi:hypothetical protein